MPKDTTLAAFDRAHETGNLGAGVRIAREVFAAKMFSAQLEDEPSALVELLLGDRHRPQQMDTELWFWYCRQLFAALVMGIAIGQLVHPDVFLKDGAR